MAAPAVVVPVEVVENPEALLPMSEAESPLKRWTFVAVAFAVTALFFYVCCVYWVPANPGTDQNGYLYGGRQLAETGTMKFAPADPGTGQFDPHQFVGRMWVGADYTKPSERFYPKYPIGLPLLVAVALKIGGPVWGPWLTYWINPIAMSAAVFGSFLLLRTFCGSYLAVLGQLVFASSPVTMLLAIDVNSHATAVCCVTWGFVGLFAWWKRGTPWVALVSGLLLGYATTIRYSEATLCVVIGLVVLFRLGKFWKASRRDWLGGILATVGWLIPVGGLLAYNLVAMRTPTGYDPTNESKPGQAFTFEHFADNWETMFRHLATYGLFFIFPISIVGLAIMFTARRRVALVMAAWIVPCLLCYTFYYWAPDGSNIGYLRFFLTIFPALVLCAMWAIGHLTRLMTWQTRSWATRLAALSVAPIIALIAAAVHMQSDARELENVQYTRLMLKTNADEMLKEIPAGSAIFFTDFSYFNHLQFMQDYTLYDVNTFRDQYIRDLLKNVDPADPQGLDPGRSKSLFDRLKDYDQKALDQQLVSVVQAQLAAKHRVFVIEQPTPKRRDKLPRPPAEIVKKLTAPPADGKSTLYSDVIDRWRVMVTPAALTSDHTDKANSSQPRQQKSTVRAITYESPWLIYEISTHTLPVSPERQAMMDYENEQKAKADQAATEKTAAEKAKQLAEKKRREDEQAKRDQEKARQDASEKAMQQRIADAQAKTEQVNAARTAVEKQLADLTAKYAASTKQVTDLQAKESAADAAAKKLTTDQAVLQQSITDLKAQQQSLSNTIGEQKKQIADLQQQLAAAKTPLPAPSTRPTTAP